jgi:hypothetical protein
VTDIIALNQKATAQTATLPLLVQVRDRCRSRADGASNEA